MQSRHARSVATAQKWCVGNRKKTYQLAATEQHENLVTGAFERPPLLALSPRRFLDGHLAKSSRPAMPERGLSGVHGRFPHGCITGELPLVVRTAVNRRFSSWMRAGDRSDGGGAVQVGNPRGLFSLVQSKPGHAIHIRTTMDFDSKRVVDPDHVCILFVVQPSRPASCPVELVELSPRRVPLDDSIPSSLDDIHNNLPIAI